VLANIVLAGLCCCLVTSCGQSDDGLSPEDPVTSLVDLFGSVLLRADGSEVATATLEQKQLIAIYFEAAWCSSCAQFTPLMMTAYDEILLAGKSFEVVFVSYGDSEEDMLAHMRDKGMTWLAIPFSGGRVDALTLRYQVQFIPTVVVLDSEANTISMVGRDEIVANGASAYDAWLAASQGG
jgi:hypothetical protein